METYNNLRVIVSNMPQIANARLDSETHLPNGAQIINLTAPQRQTELKQRVRPVEPGENIQKENPQRKKEKSAAAFVVKLSDRAAND